MYIYIYIYFVIGLKKCLVHQNNCNLNKIVSLIYIYIYIFTCWQNKIHKHKKSHGIRSTKSFLDLNS